MKGTRFHKNIVYGNWEKPLASELLGGSSNRILWLVAVDVEPKAGLWLALVKQNVGIATTIMEIKNEGETGGSKENRHSFWEAFFYPGT